MTVKWASFHTYEYEWQIGSNLKVDVVLKIHRKADKRFSWGATTLIWLTHNCLCWTRAVSGACKIWVRLSLTRLRPRASQLQRGWHQQLRWIPTQHGFLLRCSCVASAHFYHSTGMNAQTTLFYRPHASILPTRVSSAGACEAHIFMEHGFLHENAW